MASRDSPEKGYAVKRLVKHGRITLADPQREPGFGFDPRVAFLARWRPRRRVTAAPQVVVMMPHKVRLAYCAGKGLYIYPCAPFAAVAANGAPRLSHAHIVASQVKTSTVAVALLQQQAIPPEIAQDPPPR